MSSQTSKSKRQLCVQFIGLDRMPRRRMIVKIMVGAALFTWIAYTLLTMLRTTTKPAYIKPKGIDDRVLAVHREILRVKAHLENASEFRTLSEYVAKASKQRTKVILVRTSFFGQKPWGWLKDSKRFNSWEGAKCPFFRCKLTFNQNDFLKADAVVFHAKDMFPTLIMRRLLSFKPKAQKWVYFALESPMNNPPAKRLNNLFHWTLTYRRDSDFFSPYGYYYHANKNQEKEAKEIARIIRGKDKLVFWAASHCGVPREKYIRELLKYVPISVFGTCFEYVGLKNESGYCGMDNPECIVLEKRHKFILAFENSNCKDYVTEKYWTALKRGLVPIVLGGANYTSELAIPGSFINVVDFKSVKALADHLLFLDRNDHEYAKYFEWRKRYNMAVYAPWTCALCAALNMNTQKTYIARLDEFWSAKLQCGLKNVALDRIKDTGPRRKERRWK